MKLTCSSSECPACHASLAPTGSVPVPESGSQNGLVSGRPPGPSSAAQDGPRS